MVLLNNFRGMHIIDRFPCVIAGWVTLPFDKVLQGLASSEELVIDDFFNFDLLVSLHEVRGRLCKVWTV